MEIANRTSLAETFAKQRDRLGVGNRVLKLQPQEA
jgi:hypothetical protein